MEDKDILYVSKVLANPELVRTEEFQQWIKVKAHAELYWNLKAAFDNIALEKMELPQLSTEWEEFCRRVQIEHVAKTTFISTKLNKQKRSQRLRKLVRWSVAASLLLIAISAAYFLLRTTTQLENIVIVESLPQPQGVLLTKDTSSFEPQSTNNETPIVYNIIQTSRGKDTTCILSDGTEVKLNAESILKYPSSFDKSTRIVQLEGEAYFKVAHDEKIPFIVQAHGIQTRVLGTIFNIRAISDSEINVTLVEGRVSVQNIENDNPILLHPGQSASFREDGSFNVEDIDVELYTAWTQGYFHFENAPLVEIMRELGHWYNVNVEFADVEVMQQHFNFWANRNQDIKQALNLLQAVGKTRFTYKNNTVVVYTNKPS